MRAARDTSKRSGGTIARKVALRIVARVVVAQRERGVRVLTVASRISVRVHDATRDSLLARRAGARATETCPNARGPNALTPPPRRGELRILADQLASTPVAMLGFSAALSAATGGIGDALAILTVVGINAAIGYATETGAERTIAALTRAPSGSVAVRRDGVDIDVPIEQVQLGDLLVFTANGFVAADVRLVEAEELTVDQAALTGESMPVRKSAGAEIDRDVPIAERSNVVYRGTLITGGSGLGEVIAVGDETEVGRIQRLASGIDSRKTPMQQQLDQLGRQVAVGAGMACAATLGVGLLRGQAALPMFRTAISLAVAAVPEGLPTVAITTLALGLNRLRDQRVLVRQLAAVETLGAVQVVCFDKTGTLTENRMTVVAGHAGSHPLEIKAGVIEDGDGESLTTGNSDLATLLRVAVLCNEAELADTGTNDPLRGSPTEAALLQVAIDAGVDVRGLRARYPRLTTQHRAEARSYMCTLHEAGGRRLLAVKGAPIEVLALCTSVRHDGADERLGDVRRAAIERENASLAARALRVLGFAYAEFDEGEEAPSSFTWAGLLAMADPPRPDLPPLLAAFRRAGVRTMMITGDQTATADAIGRQIGLADGGALESVDSTQLDRIDPDALREIVQRASVFSRVSPAHKLQIVQALQAAGQVVAMTGDGVNDGPALKAADLGIAMGGNGESAAREVATMVLADDDLGRLLHAIEQGRAIYDDVRKAAHFILATNLGEILYTFAATAGAGTPLSPMQLLWINLLTDIAPEIALAMEPPESDVLQRPPRDSAQPMFGGSDLRRIGFEGALITAFALGAHGWARVTYGDGPRSSSVGFTALTMGQLLHGFSARSATHSLFDRERHRDDHGRALPVALYAMGGLQVVANFIPAIRGLLGTERLSLRDWGAVLLSAGAPFLINEATKLAMRDGRTAQLSVSVG